MCASGGCFGRRRKCFDRVHIAVKVWILSKMFFLWATINQRQEDVHLESIPESGDIRTADIWIMSGVAMKKTYKYFNFDISIQKGEVMTKNVFMVVLMVLLSVSAANADTALIGIGVRNGDFELPAAGKVQISTGTIPNWTIWTEKATATADTGVEST
jgi:hypothetical protein